MQTDPIGYGDGMNMYAYVGNDPMNGVDPTGLAWCGDICVTASRPGGISLGGGFGGNGIAPTTIPPAPYTCEHAPMFGWDPRNCFDTMSYYREPTPTQPEETGAQKEEVVTAEKQSCSGDLSSTVGSARLVLATTADVSGLASVGFAAAGITAPAAVASKIVNVGAQGLLGALTFYDWAANGNWAPLAAQGAALVATLLSHYGKIPVYDARRKLDANPMMKRRLLPLCVMPLLAPVARMERPLLLAGAAVVVALLIAYCIILYRGWRSAERA